MHRIGYSTCILPVWKTNLIPEYFCSFPGGKCGWCMWLTTLPPPRAVVMKSGNLNFLEPRSRRPGSSVGIATGYGLDGPRIESRWGRHFRTCPDRPWGPSSLLYSGYRVFPGVRKRPGRDANLSPPSSAEV